MTVSLLDTATTAGGPPPPGSGAAPTGTSAATPAPSAPAGGGGAPALPEWLAALPDDLKGEKSLHSFKDIGSLAKSYVETKRLVGAKTEGLVKVPGPTASPEEKAAFAKAVGVPETPDGYVVEVKAGLPEALTAAITANLPKARARAHAWGLTPQQFAQAVQAEIDDAVAAETAAAAKRAEAKAALEKEWGAAFPANLAKAGRAFLAIATSPADREALKAALDASGLADDPAFLRAFAALADTLGESALPENEAGAGATAASAKAELDAFMADAETQKKYLSGDTATVEKAQRLFRAAYGNASAYTVTGGVGA